MTPDEAERYSRQVRFRGIGEEGQSRIIKSRVAVVGCGALGSFAAAAMARAGVGYLILTDRDYVEISNLHRQWLYTETDAAEGVPKAVAAGRHIASFASGCSVTATAADLTTSNIDELLGGADLILDGTDNFETRYLINDFAVQRGIPWIYGAAVESYGLAMPVLPGQTACLACVYPTPPSGVQATCETAGVIGPITSLVASLQCALALRILSGGTVQSAITTADVWDMALRVVRHVERDPACRACVQRRFEYLENPQRVPVSLCGRNAVQIHDHGRPLDLAELQRRLEKVGQVRANEFALRLFLPPYEMTIFPDGRAIVKGTQDVSTARSLYARFIGS